MKFNKKKYMKSAGAIRRQMHEQWNTDSGGHRRKKDSADAATGITRHEKLATAAA